MQPEITAEKSKVRAEKNAKKKELFGEN